MPITSDSATAPPRSWWREPMLWLVIGGPALVVLAGIATAVVAVRGADLPLDTRSNVPALQGRNHAATMSGGAESAGKGFSSASR